MIVRGALALFLAVAASAQDERPDTIAGRVLDADRRPIRAASVVLLHRPVPALFDPEHEHRVVVETDAEGMFRAEVLSSRTYSVWSTWSGGASGVVEGAEAGAFVTLVRDPIAESERVVIDGLGAWRDRGPFGFRTVIGGESVDFAKVPATGEELSIPALPAFEYRQIEVLAADGEVLWCGAARTRGSDNVLTLSVPEPVEVDVRVVDSKTGEPIADAEILWHIRNYWTTRSPAVANMDRFRPLWPRVGTTDAAGGAHIRLPAHASDGKVDGLWLMARKRGFGSSSSGRLDGRDYRDGVYVEDGGDSITMKLVQSPSPAVRLRLGDESFIESGSVGLSWRVWARGDRGGSGTMYADSGTVADGVLTIVHPPAANTELESVGIALPIGFRESIAQQLGCLPPSFLRVAVKGDLPATEFDLRSRTEGLRLVEVISPFGQPAARTVLITMKIVKGEEEPGGGFRYRTDRLGRALVSVAEMPLRVLAMGDGMWGVLDVTEDSVAPLHVVMEELPSVRVRVLDASDQPVPGAVLTTAAFSPLRGGESDDRLGQSSGAELGRWAQVVRGDAEGWCELTHPPVAGTLRVVIRDPWRPRERRGSGELVLPPDPAQPEAILRWNTERD